MTSDALTFAVAKKTLQTTRTRGYHQVPTTPHTLSHILPVVHYNRRVGERNHRAGLRSKRFAQKRELGGLLGLAALEDVGEEARALMAQHSAPWSHDRPGVCQPSGSTATAAVRARAPPKNSWHWRIAAE